MSRRQRWVDWGRFWGASLVAAMLVTASSFGCSRAPNGAEVEARSNALTSSIGGLVAVPLPTTGWTATVSSSSSTDVPSRALDGDPATRWSTGQPQANGQFFQVDMGASHLITQVTLDTSGSSSDYPRGYALYLSSDGTSWGTPVLTGAGTGPITQLSFAWQGARFLKIVQTGTASNWWSIDELSVFGAGRAALPRTGWIPSASLTCQSDVPAHALDGQVSTRWSTGVPQADSNQWFQVNMLSPQTFARIVMDSGSSSGDFAHQYQVLVSNDGTSWSGPVATGKGTSQVVTVDFPTQKAQYIRVYQTGSATNWWSIHEFNVYTAFPLEPCTLNVPADATLTGSAKEIKYQQDILAFCTGAGCRPVT